MSEKIVVLSDKEQARKRINVFHGSAENWINMIKELIGNSLDIFKKQELYNQQIKIIIHNPNKIEYIDSATGIPVEGVASNGKDNYEAIFEKAFGGSNFDNSSATVGQNGIFLFTLSMTCEDVEYFIARPNGNLYNIKYHKGDRVEDLKVIGKEDKTYTRIIFSLDTEVWNNPHFTFEEISKIAQAQASLSKLGTRISVEDKINNKHIEFYYPNGIEDYFNEMVGDKSIVSDNIEIKKSLKHDFTKEQGYVYGNGTSDVTVTEYTDEIDMDLIFNYSDDNEEDFQKEFLNTADLLLHGTIQEGIFQGLKSSIDKWLVKNNKYNKNEKHITIEDVSTGLNYICNMSSLYVEYDNQIKQRTSVNRYKQIVKDIIEEYMEVFFIENPLMSDRICTQVLINSRAKIKADKARKTIKKELSENIVSSINRPKKFVPCRSKDPNEIELIIIEGDSAMNSVRLARDSKYMCVYPLKGKPINAVKNKLDLLLKNQEVKDIFKILGCGMSYKGKKIRGIPMFDMSKLKIKNILFSTDFDEDGFHIQSLLIGLFYILSPELIEKGVINILYSPLYIIKTNKEEIFAYSEREKNDITKSLKTPYKITRYKGLGGLPVTAMAKAMSKEHRLIKKVTMNDVAKSIETINLFLSEEKLKERKEYIETFGSQYFDYTIFD